MLTCFVIQGFGKKTDYTDGRELDLNASYEIIKKAVLASGLECVRADEIIHSGPIDIPMYERLLNADLVIADLSTYNVNACFELGVRYALKPYSTIVLAEEKFKNPFDINHIIIHRYKHLGEEIGFKEADRLITKLQEIIATVLEKAQTDSPVYTHLPQLLPPKKNTPAITNQSETVIDTSPVLWVSALSHSTQTIDVKYPNNSRTATKNSGNTPLNYKSMLDIALTKMKDNAFLDARDLLEAIRQARPDDLFVLHQLVIATYKCAQPSALSALEKATLLLNTANPETTNNPETLSLWGAIHKNLWKQHHKIGFLNESIQAYERSFAIKQDHYAGSNLAYLLNLRAVELLKKGHQDEAVADFVLAKRTRQNIMRYTKKLLKDITVNDINDSNEERRNEFLTVRYSMLAALLETAIGLGDEIAYRKWETEARTIPIASWMEQKRLKKEQQLRDVLQVYRRLPHIVEFSATAIEHV